MASPSDPAPPGLPGSPGAAGPAALAATAEQSGERSLVGQRVGKYEIVRLIGRGGMGTVYEALNTSIGKRVAMKFVDAETARSKDASIRFQREAEAASAVESAHIVDIFDSGYSEDGQPFIVMELLRGEDLGYRIKRCGRLELGEALHITAQILRGLHRAHEAGIVHRDLKPDNVFLVDRDDDATFAKILDFGISKIQRSGSTPLSTLTRQGTVLGTPFYMSPEQAQAMPDIDGRTDLWSAGAILYECLTGRPPYHGNTYEQVIVNICMHDAEDVRAHNPAVPEPIAQVIARALKRDRNDRFPSARQFLDALKGAAGGVVSSRSGQILVEDSISGELRVSPGLVGSGPRIVGPGSGPRSPGSPGSPGAIEPSPEVKLAGTSRVGWSTSRREGARRDKRTFAVVAISALLAGVIAAFLYLRGKPVQAPGPSPTASADEASVELKANVAGARYSVDGAPVPGGVLRGKKGETKRVRVEADGYAPSELDVTLEAQEEPLRIVLALPERAVSPVVTPAAPPPPPAPEPPPAQTGTQAKGSASAKAPRGPAKPGPSAVKTAEMAVLPPPPPLPPPAPPPSGVGGNHLKLKTD
ncbi:MAG: serine/threonine-protein kinase [Byssovorax sp.]